MSSRRDELIPEWTQGDRLRKARTLTGLNVRQFAEQIGVSHGTVTNAELGKREVRRITLNAWAYETGVSVEWLEHGGGPVPSPPNGTRDDLAVLTEHKRSRRRSSSPGSTRRYAASAKAA